MRPGGPHIIIGNSAAGLSAIKAIRASGDHRPIVLVSAEKSIAYSPVLTTYYIGGQIGKKGLYFVNRDFYQRHQVKLVLGRKVMEVDTRKHRLLLDDGSHLGYGSLLISSGASARSLGNVKKSATRFVSSLRTISDADKIKSLAAQARDVVAAGAGLVSLQTIKAIAGPQVNIKIVVGSGQVLSQQMDWESATLIQRKLESNGVEILFGRSISEVSEKNGRALVTTNYGEHLPADLVVVGKGVSPNISMVMGSPIKTDWGILVDDRMRTNAECVFAAGDVAEGVNQITGQREVIATWYNACAQGEVAGANMAGRTVRRNGQIKENITTLFNVVVASIGESNSGLRGYEEIRHIDQKRGIIRKFFFKGSVMVGALLVGHALDAGVIRHCIANGIDLHHWKDSLTSASLDFTSILCGQGFEWPQLTQ